MLLVFSLAACGGSSGGSAVPIPGSPGGNGNSTNSAPVLTPIASINAVTGSLLRFELAGSDVDGDRLTYSSSDTAGTFNNPFMQTTPAVLNETNGVFEWTPTGLEIGQYSVTFTVTEETSEQLSSSITVNITIDTLGSFGLQFYAINCAGCHGAAPGTKAGRTAAQIQAAIDGLSVMSGLSGLTAAEVKAIADAIGGGTPAPAPTTPEGLYNTYCAACHGAGGYGGVEEGVRDASASDISAAIAAEADMNYLGALLASSSIDAIADYLSGSGGGGGQGQTYRSQGSVC